MGRFAYAGGRPLYRVYAPRREYAFMEENGPVDHGRLRRKRCERGCVLFPITGRAQEDVAPDVFGRSTYVGADHQLNRMNSP